MFSIDLKSINSFYKSMANPTFLVQFIILMCLENVICNYHTFIY